VNWRRRVAAAEYEQRLSAAVLFAAGEQLSSSHE
jgi:hypothetical protein